MCTARTKAAAISIAILFALSSIAAAQDEREPGWYDAAEFSLISTSGNSESSTFGFKNALERLWDGSTFRFDLGGLRADSTTTTRFATGTPTSFQTQETSVDDLIAENYYLRGRYDRQITEKFFWFGGASWERNEFAGFDSRTSIYGGIGQIWWQQEDSHFRTDYGLSYTTQDDLVPNPSIDDGYLGLRFSWDYLRKLGNASYQNLLVLDPNIDETDDWRVDMINSLSVSMTDKVALKVSFQLLYDNLPGLVAIPLVDASNTPTGDLVFGELDELDTLFTVALVVSLL